MVMPFVLLYLCVPLCHDAVRGHETGSKAFGVEYCLTGTSLDQGSDQNSRVGPHGDTDLDLTREISNIS